MSAGYIRFPGFEDYNSVTYLSDNTFVIPDGVNGIWFYGAGGGGGGGRGGVTPGGGSGAGSGGAGAIPMMQFRTVVPGNTLTINVGQGGTGGQVITPDIAEEGEDTTVTSPGMTTVTFKGGQAGKRQDVNNRAYGAAGGSAFTAGGDAYAVDGLVGVPGAAGTDSEFASGGAGGSAAGAFQCGGGGGGAGLGAGGNGGDGVATIANQGEDAAANSSAGGGGGGYDNGTSGRGGNGGSGILIIYYLTPRG